ncbi:MAG: hypothetical protein PHH93_04440 [Prolixibacteraceae bacterium]|nr:hypothetical protein [Prolixibacteraceae bacterium]
MKNIRFFPRLFCVIIMLSLFANLQLLYANLAVSSTQVMEGEKVFRAGAATSNITPQLGGGIVGNFGNPPPATHVHDELHARCLALDDGSTQLIFIIVDIIGLNRDLIDETKRIIFEETNIPPSNVLISAVHTHSATSAQGVGSKRSSFNGENSFDEYQNFLIRRFADVARIALNNLEPARIGWGAGSVPEHVFVRRWKFKPGSTLPNPFGGYDKAKMNPGRDPNLLEPAAVPDPEVSFISVQSTAGRPIALLANYSLHYVGGVPRNHISADYFGAFADRIQELLKADRQDPPFVGIMSNGTSGDVNNINLTGPVEKNPPYAKIRKVADDVAREVFRAHNKIEFQDWVPLGAALEELTLQVRKPDEKMIERANYVLTRPDTEKPFHVHEKTYANRILNLLDWPDQINIVLQTFRIGDLGVAAIPFETFAETGLEIKERSPLGKTFTIELANGSYGYLPTPEQHELGGYETWMGTNRVEKEASVKIVSKLLNMFSGL